MTKYTYDAAGNLLSVTDALGNTNRYVYDCHGNLITHTDALGNTETYAYDANGNCITKTNAAGTAFHMSYDALGRVEKVSAEVNGKKISNTYAYDRAGRVTEVTDAEGGKQSFAYDMYGNLISATDEDGEVRHTFCYGTYGELLGNGTLGTDMASGIRFLFNGEYGVSTDKNRLNYMLTRYYNTDIRRFMNRDVLTGSIGESQSLNRYSYVQGNPVSLVDPFGLCPESTFSAFSGHALLDLLGLVFDGADLVNAIWYLAEGDVKNAVMSAGALLPVIGAIGAGGIKLAKSGIKLGSRVTDAARYTRSFARYADKAGTAVKCAGRKYDDIKTAIKTALKKSDGAKAAGKAVGKGGSGRRIANKFPNEPMPNDGKILDYYIENKRIKGIEGRNNVDFVITTDYNLIIGNKHHYLGNGQDVFAAGQLKVNGQGQIKRIDNLSGHYRPTVDEAMRYQSLFEHLGLDLNKTWLEYYRIDIDSSGMVVNTSLDYIRMLGGK